MKFVEEGSYLEAQINFLGKRISAMVEKCDEPQSELAKKIKSAKVFWEKNELKIRNFLRSELRDYRSKPDFINSEIEMQSIVLQLTHDDDGSSNNTTNIVFEFLIPYEDVSSEVDIAFTLTPNVVYQLGYSFRGTQIVWNDPTLNLDFDANAFD